MANRGAMDTIASTHTITVAQAAEALGVSERTVWRYLKSGRLPGETVGEPGSQRTLIPCEAVDALRGRPPGCRRRRPARRARPARRRSSPPPRAERDALSDRVSVLQRSLSTPAAAGIAERALSRALAIAAAAAPAGPRAFSLR